MWPHLIVTNVKLFYFTTEYSAVQYGKTQAMILISKDTKRRTKIYITIYKEKDEKEP